MAETRTKIGRMVFESVRGNKYTVEIYKRGATATAVRELTPASNPFSTRENTSDDPMEPVRGSTGYMRFWYEGGTRSDGAPWWMDFVPADATEIKVVLKDSADAIQWQGYAQPSQYSHDYNEPQQEIELPLVSMLEVLGAIEMDATNIMKSTSWRWLMVEAIEKCEMSVSKLYTPYEWGTKELSTEIVKTGVKDINWAAPLTTYASRFAWFDVTDAKNGDDPNWKEYEGKTYADMLADWCRYWGWCLKERGTELYLVSKRTTKYRQISWSVISGELMTDALLSVLGPEDGIIDAETLTLGDDKLDGKANSLNITPAVRTVVVSADTQPVDSVMVKVEDDNTAYYDNSYNVYTRFGYSAAQFETVYLKMLRYRILKGKTLNAWNEFEQYPDGTTNQKNTYYARLDFGKDSALSEKKNWTYKDGIIVFYEAQKMADGMPVFDDQRVFEIHSRKSFEVHNGALCICPSFQNLKKGVQLQYTYFQLKFGDKYWNGTAWVNEKSKFTIPMITDASTKSWDFSPVDQKTLSMDYCNGAEGYIIPITEQMSGEISLAWLASHSQDENNYIFVTDFKVEYFGTEDNEYRNLETTNNYYALTGAKGEDTKTISLRLATENNNNAGFGLIKFDGVTATGTTYRTPSTPSTTAVVARPEEVLLSTARGIYGESQKRLEMVVTVANRERPIDLITRAEWTGTWQPVAESIEWVNDRRTLMLMQ